MNGPLDLFSVGLFIKAFYKRWEVKVVKVYRTFLSFMRTNEYTLV